MTVCVSVDDSSLPDRNITALNLFICFMTLQMDLNLFILMANGKALDSVYETS